MLKIACFQKMIFATLNPIICFELRPHIRPAKARRKTAPALILQIKVVFVSPKEPARAREDFRAGTFYAILFAARSRIENRAANRINHYLK